MGIFAEVFTNLYWDGEVAAHTPDANGDYYLITDAQADHEYLQEKIADSLSAISGAPTTTFLILYGGRVSDAGSGKINITEGVVRTLDTNSKKRLVHIPALNNVSLPSGWNDGRSIWVTARYDFKLGTATRNHKAGTSYHYQIIDTYMGDSNGYISTSTDDLFASSDPVATAAILGKFTMTGTTYADLGVRSPSFPVVSPIYDYIVDSQDKFDLLVASSTWLNAKNVLFTCNITRAAQTTIPSTVEKIHAINGATLTVSSLTTGQYGIKYTARPTDNKYEIKGLTVSASGTGNVTAFYYCINLTNCTGAVTSSTNGSAFSSCNNLVNCVGTHTGSGNSVTCTGFNICNNLDNCTGTGTATGTDSQGNGFYDCDYVINCTGTGTATGTASGAGFSYCSYVINCTGTGVSSATGSRSGFTNSEKIMNCNGFAATGSATGRGFAFCDQISNTTATGYGSTTGHCYYSCTYSNGCRKSGTPSTAVWGGTNTFRDDQSCDVT